jgi:hypothetical protein
MARLIYFALAIIFYVSCQPKATEVGVENDSVTREQAPIAAIEEKKILPRPVDSVYVTRETSPYIGDIDAFEETREYYTMVYYRSSDSTADDYDYLAARADSVIFEDDEMRRKRIPADIAERYFEIAGMERISVYNNGRHISDADLVRVELLEGVIERHFIAVFRPVDPSSFNPEVSYCISTAGLTAKKTDLTSVAIDDSVFTKELVQTLGLEPDTWNSVHVKTKPYNATYSGITCQSKAYLIETYGGKSTILKEINEDYYIGAIVPVHLEINGKPVLLLHMGVNETDMVWTSLAVFSGTTYEFLQGNRLNGEVYL